MPVAIIPFKMPEPAAIPPHIVEHLQRLEPDEAVRMGMDLLVQIDAAETLLFERVTADGILELGGAGGADAERAAALEEALRGESCYGRRLIEAPAAPTGAAFAQNSALLVMGQVERGASGDLLPAVLAHMLGGQEAGNVGFNYVLPLAVDGRPLGGLTLFRPAAAGPLNHEQPNLTEALCRVLAGVLAGG